MILITHILHGMNGNTRKPNRKVYPRN
jgi:hypothetical protein